MKNIKLYVSIIILILFLNACSNPKPKTAPVKNETAVSLDTVLQPVNSSVISTVTAISPQQKEIATAISGQGYLDFDTRTFNNIAARFSGRIEKLYIKYAFQEIHAGQRIFDIYSPELVTAQQDLIFLTRNSPLETGLINAAKQKILLLGMSDSQVNQVIKTGKPYYRLPVYSLYDGHVHDASHTQMAGPAEKNTPADFATDIPLAIKEGTYVQKGQTLFNVVNPHQLWAIIKIDRSSVAGLRLNQEVKLNFPDLPEQTITGKVNFIEPSLQDGDKTTSIRIYLTNKNHDLKVNTLVRATIQTGKTNGLWIPASALVNLGRRQIVWIKNGGSYQAHQVDTGISNDNEVQILKGLSLTDSLASDAQYLTDSESFIKIHGHE